MLLHKNTLINVVSMWRSAHTSILLSLVDDITAMFYVWFSCVAFYHSKHVKGLTGSQKQGNLPL